MKKLVSKAKDHGKKIVIHLKRHHKKYLFGSFCGGVLALFGIFIANSINNIFADGIRLGNSFNLGNTSEYPIENELVKVLTKDNFSDLCTKTHSDDGWDIDCSNHGIDGIAYGAFSGYNNINILDLSKNNISSLDFYYGYQGVNPSPDNKITVKKLNLSYNNITKVRSFYPKLHELNPRVIVGTTKLGLLEREAENNIWNMIVIKDGGTINLSNNNIYSIEDGAFSGLYLEDLYLSDNNLSEINYRAFDGIKSINGLDLGNNYIFNINLTHIPGLKYLHLDGNCIPESTLENLNNIFSIPSDIIEFNNDQKACFYLSYDPNELTSGDVSVTLTLTGNFNYIDVFGGFSEKIGFTENGTKNFDVRSLFEYSGYIRNYPSTPKDISVTVDWIDKDAPSCNVQYSTTETTNQNIVAKLTGCSESISCINCDDGESMQHQFTGNGDFTFEFKDAVGNTGSIGASVTRIDKIIPTCSVKYSTTGWTNQTVTATLTGCNKTGISVTQPNGSWTYSFNTNGTFTFEFEDSAGNTGSTDATVSWINKDVPTCSVKYSTTGWTNQTVTATLTGCSKTGITVLRPNGSWTYPFASNGNFTFEFRDAAGNTGSTNATVSWIDKDKPSCSISYETQGESGHESTTARLTGCSENITVTNTSGNAKYYVLGYSGAFTFQFKDRANNTGKAIASYNMPKYTIQVNNSREMLSLFTGNGAISCEYNYNSGNYSQKFVIYIKTGAAYAQLDMSGTTLTYGSELFINDKIYQWGSYYSSLGSGEGIYTNYDFNVTEVIHSLFGSSSGGTVFMCATGIDDDSVFDLPNDITFYSQSHYAATHDIYFSIIVDDSIKAGEYNNFTVKVVKNGQRLKDYDGRIYFELLDENGDLVDDDYYVIGNRKYYDFGESDSGRKTFTDGLKINKAGTYILRVYDRDDYEGTETIVVRGKNGNIPSNFEYDTLKFDSGYSTEMNMAYQFARYYDITTINNIKDAKMSSGLNRIAMAKMLANYAENVLGIDDFDTSRNCNFTDVPSSLDKDYDYGVTKACQLGIMGVNMKSGKFYPKGGVTRAEFATALSRLLYNTSDGTDKYYSTHIYKLYREGIITNTDPDLREKRGYVMLMLMRASEDYDY